MILLLKRLQVLERQIPLQLGCILARWMIGFQNILTVRRWDLVIIIALTGLTILILELTPLLIQELIPIHLLEILVRSAIQTLLVVRILHPQIQTQ
jgi:hypothetical protein